MNRATPFVPAVLTAVLFASNVSAGPISDTADNSFIDESTGLEWMDFGINTGQSYNFVKSQLGYGGLYEGWQLPSKSQVYELWANAFLGAGAFYSNANHYGPGQLLTNDGAGTPGSVHTTTQAAMGYNIQYDTNNIHERNYAYGWFDGTDGLSYVDFSSHTDRVGITYRHDHARLYDINNQDWALNRQFEERSTLLVKTTDVSAPATLGFLSLGLIGLFWRHRKNV